MSLPAIESVLASTLIWTSKVPATAALDETGSNCKTAACTSTLIKILDKRNSPAANNNVFIRRIIIFIILNNLLYFNCKRDKLGYHDPYQFVDKLGRLPTG